MAKQRRSEGCRECRTGVLCADARRLLRELAEEEAALVEAGEMRKHDANKTLRRLSEVGLARAETEP